VFAKTVDFGGIDLAFSSEEDPEPKASPDCRNEIGPSRGSPLEGAVSLGGGAFLDNAGLADPPGFGLTFRGVAVLEWSLRVLLEADRTDPSSPSSVRSM